MTSWVVFWDRGPFQMRVPRYAQCHDRLLLQPILGSFQRMYPEDTYLMQLGRALYANNYLEWLIIEVIQLLDATPTMVVLAAMEGGQTVKSLDKAIAGRKDLEANLIARLADLATLYERHVNRRNDIVHARPATTERGEQRLYRWDAKRGVTPHFLTSEQLTEFADSAMEVARGFRGVRQQLKR